MENAETPQFAAIFLDGNRRLLPCPEKNSRIPAILAGSGALNRTLTDPLHAELLDRKATESVG
jgi:hypothetical protein